ncbi:MAG: cache domain-containing protein [Proteobacteria bacterium]|nr:cache domain-containing protein [Pseudomonadota bacterium]
MRRYLMAGAALALIGAAGAAYAAERATAAEAEALVKKAVAYVNANGAEKAYAEFTNKKGQFTDRDLYIVVYGLDGVVRAHGQNEKLIGKDMSEAQDVDGKYFVKERIELAKSQGNFWQDYKFTDPLTKKVEPKRMYCERLSDVAVCGGVYKS